MVLDHDYEERMKCHPYGIALYHPLSSHLFNTGSCGYFDDSHSWNPIGHLSEPDSLLRLDLKVVTEELQKAPIEDDIHWGPKCSTGTNGIKLNLSASACACPPGIPVGVGAVFEYSNSRCGGAILLTKPPVVHERYYYESPFKNWVKGNAQSLLQVRPEISRYGLWIVTSIYSTNKCSINSWSTGDKKLAVGFAAKVVNAGDVGPRGDWFESSRDDGWNHHEAKKDGERKVVFFGGLRFRFTSFFGHQNIKQIHQNKTTFRGDRTAAKTVEVATFPLSDDEFCLVECDSWVEEPSVDEGEGDDF